VGVTAKDHTAVVTLGRGGLARVCQTSALHMTQSKATEGGASPLLFSLDRGAVEIRMNGLANDSIMTPDLRMTVQANGPLDVRLRVARNGDTCVENRGGAAPALAVSDPFGASQYELMAGQHVLFEHGSLTEVVDREAEPCGCPDAKGGTVADALLAPGSEKMGARTSTPPTAVELHPFPAAISEGLAPAAPPSGPEADPAQPQATDALVYNAKTTADNAKTTADAPADTDAANGKNVGAAMAPGVSGAGRSAARASAGTSPSVSAASLGSAPSARHEPVKAKTADADQSPNRDLMHMIGHFFRKMFGH
jgi:hypothetical protein